MEPTTTETTEDTVATEASGQVKTKDPDAIKLFVGQLPRTASEEELLTIFEEYGPVFELHILRDKITGSSKGCAFVTFCQRSSADKCMQALHGQHTLPGMSHPMQVKLADSEQQKEEQRKLFVGMVSKMATEDQLRTMFATYGTVEDLTILRSPDGTSKGCAFVRFATLPEAMAAVTGLNGSLTMDGCSKPLVVKPAETEKEKAARRMERDMTMGNMGPYGMNSMFPGAMMYQQMPPQAMMQGYGGMAVGMQKNMGGMVGQDMSQYGMQPGAYGYMPNPAAMGYGGAQAAPSTTATGPEGANLFIYHLPIEWGDYDLCQAFAPFGTLVSAKVFVDKNTNQSKCFGFVSYDSSAAATLAIQHMNGYQIGSKRLKVQLKRSKDASRPY